MVTKNSVQFEGQSRSTVRNAMQCQTYLISRKEIGRDVSQIQGKSESMIKPDVTSSEDELSKIVFSGVKLKKSEIRLIPESLYP